MPCRAGTTAWQFQTAAHGQMALRSGSDEHIKKEHRRLVVQLRDTQSRKNIGIVGMYLPAMPIFLYLLRLAA